MTEYLNMWKNYVNFSDRTSVRGYWMAFLFNIIAAFIVGLVAGIVAAIADAPSLVYLGYIYSLAVFLPELAITVRRLRDAGKSWTNVFWLFLPVIGWIIILVLLCKKSVEDNGLPVV